MAAGAHSADRQRSGRPSTGHYRQHLDGLRAVAVYLVVVFHAGSEQFRGGFVGVDVFFVLSGFLVTQLLLRDLVNGGSISFARFYSRRFRRLLPAAFVVLVVTAVAFSAVASPIEVADAEGGFQASFLYYANWYFIADAAGYFGANVESSPVLHFWSLAVEEQFYLLWPLLLGGLFVVSRRAGRRQWQIMRLIVLSGTIASLLWAWSLKSTDPNRAYYGTDARAYQLLAGALLALVPGLLKQSGRAVQSARMAGLAALMALVALVAIASSWTDLDPIERGTAATVTTLVVIVGLERASGGVAKGVLSIEPVVYLGKISYGIYLWHWPVILLLARSFDLSQLTTVALASLLATALASLSYQLLEHPIRLSSRLDRRRTAVIAVGLSISLVSAFVIIPDINKRSTNSSGADASAFAAGSLTPAGFTPVPRDLDFVAIAGDFVPVSNCYGEPAQGCTIVKGSGAHILLIGDSHAAMMVPTFEAIANQQDLTLSVTATGGCPWQLGLYTPPLEVSGEAILPEDCERLRADLYDRVIPALQPDLVVTMNLAWEVTRLLDYRDSEGTNLGRGSPEYDALVERTTISSVERLKADGRNVLLLEPIPIDAALTSNLDCLADAAVVEECRVVVDTEPTVTEQVYRRLDDADDQVWAADLDRQVCPFLPICDPIVNQMVTKMDDSHLHDPFARSLAPVVAEYLEDNGILSG